MTQSGYEVTDRRPIAARRIAVINRVAQWLAGAGVSANAISVAGMIGGILAGVSLYSTSLPTGPWMRRALWLTAAVLIQFRLLANLLDGMVAIASGTASPLGEIFNDAPDRVSDSAALVGLGYAIGGQPALGWCAALLAMTTAYVRVLGKASGAASDFRGPMAKQHRMFLVTISCLLSAFAPRQIGDHAVTWCLGLICAGCVITICRRLTGIVSGLRITQ